tara:strand:+ start:3211 stop:3573 length:363 start_codon:yes stop_codon:yes gene_type:complete
MAQYDSSLIQLKQVVKKGEPFEHFDLSGLNDEDLNGNNGLDYVSQAAQDSGFDNDIEYWDSILPNQKVETIEQLEENWNFLMEKLKQSSSYYAHVDPILATLEVENSIVVIASASIQTYI